jgi:hypothetical protein
MKIDASDRATGLPPMRPMRHDEEIIAIVLAGESGGQGIVEVPGSEETLAVKYLHVRGILTPLWDPEAEPEWTQRALAIPVELVPAIIAALKSA